MRIRESIASSTAQSSEGLQDDPNESESPSANQRLDLKVIYRLTNSLRPSPKNARTHSKKQIRKLRDSILAFGFVNPVLIGSEKQLIAGHGRVEAAKLLKMTEVPTICLSDLTHDQIRAYMIADNRLALDAGWDQDLLKIELLHLESLVDFDSLLTGFEIPEIDLLIGAAPGADDPGDRIPPIRSHAVTQRGDLWVLGNHRIYCGDARDADSYARLLDGRTASVVFTDPPYNVAIDGHASGNGKTEHRDFIMASGEMSEAEFTNFLALSLGEMAKVSKDGAVHFVAMDWRSIGILSRVGESVYDSMLNLCVWSKNNGGMGSLYRSQHELIFVFKVGTAAHRNNIHLGKFGRNRTNVWNYPGANTLTRQGTEGNLLAMHPTVKPIALVADALLDCSARGEIVLDGFLGAGSTLLAAERVGRICYGMEIDPLYVDLSIRRWEQVSGEHAHNLKTGIPFGRALAEEVSHA